LIWKKESISNLDAAVKSFLSGDTEYNHNDGDFFLCALTWRRNLYRGDKKNDDKGKILRLMNCFRGTFLPG